MNDPVELIAALELAIDQLAPFEAEGCGIPFDQPPLTLALGYLKTSRRIAFAKYGEQMWAQAYVMGEEMLCEAT